jgi:hypothetical protein
MPEVKATSYYYSAVDKDYHCRFNSYCVESTERDGGTDCVARVQSREKK